MPPRRRRPQLHPLVKDVAGDSKVTWMLYAHPGVGKTTLIGTGPDNTLIIRPPTDSLDPIKRANPRMKQVTVHGWNELLEILQWLRDENGAGFEWVWLDSISLVQDTGLDDVWADTILRKPSRAEFGLDKPEYGINMFRLGQWVRHAVGAEAFNLGITAHPAILPNPDRDDDDDDAPYDIMMPWVQGKMMATKVCGYCNLVTYYRVEKVKVKGQNGRQKRRVLYTDASEVYYAKNSLAPIPRGRLVSPTIPKVMSYVLGNQNGATE